MTARRITFACQPYDRMQALRDGSVPVRGVELNFLPLPVEETFSFYRMLRFQEFDAAELSLSSYVLTLPGSPFIVVPVFPSWAFRHSAVYAREDSGFHEPIDLAGARVGVPEYQITAAVWIRGILQEHHGLDSAFVHYRTGA